MRGAQCRKSLRLDCFLKAVHGARQCIVQLPLAQWPSSIFEPGLPSAAGSWLDPVVCLVGQEVCEKSVPVRSAAPSPFSCGLWERCSSGQRHHRTPICPPPDSATQSGTRKQPSVCLCKNHWSPRRPATPVFVSAFDAARCSSLPSRPFARRLVGQTATVCSHALKPAAHAHLPNLISTSTRRRRYAILRAVQ